MSLFSQRLLSLRQERRLSQAAVAKAVEVTTRTYQRYEAGEREPMVTVLVRFAKFYGTSTDYLVGLREKK